MTDPAVDSCKGMWRRAADEGMGLWIWKGGKRAQRCRSSWASPVFVLARDQPPISPSEIQLSGLFTALATVFVQAPNPFLSLFFLPLTPYSHFLSEGQCYIWHCLLKLQPRFIGFAQWRENNHSILGQDLAEDEPRCSGDSSAKN